MKLDVFTTEKMRTACSHMIQDIQRLDYISAHNVESDKVYRDVLKSLEESLCAIELSVGEMRSDLTLEDKDAIYRDLLAEKDYQEEIRLFLADRISHIQTELKGLFNEANMIPKRFLEE